MPLLRNMTNDAYHADRTAVSKSWLDRINRSPAHFYHYLHHPKKTTAALEIGQLAHSLILENDISRYVVTPNFNCSTSEGRLRYQDYLKELNSDALGILMHQTHNRPKREELDALLLELLASQGKISCTDDQLQTVKNIRDSVHRHPAAKQLLAKGEPELTSFYTDKETGLLCKARADWYRPDLGWIVDLKSTRSAHPEEFRHSAAKYRYHVQAAHYLPAFDADQFLFIALEKEEPYAVAVYNAECALPAGRAQRYLDLLAYKTCLDQNYFPGYGEDIQDLILPTCATRDLN